MNDSENTVQDIDNQEVSSEARLIDLDSVIRKQDNKSIYFVRLYRFFLLLCKLFSFYEQFRKKCSRP